MKILSIETSCDETAISIVDAKGGFARHEFNILANVVHSQVDLHAQYGGVYPNLAKREHAKNLIPVLKEALVQGFGKTKIEEKNKKEFPKAKLKKIEKLLEREPELLAQFLKEIPKVKKPKIDAIAVTYGPGLEPALWVGINFAKALSFVWDMPIIPTNHMEGHIVSSLLGANSKSKNQNSKDIEFPMLALLVSGGHTELILIKDWLKYGKIGQTRDDAVGEAFDKVARTLGLPYPGGPEISKLAQLGSSTSKYELPRPMINSGDFDFSFSGLKTAVLYMVKNIPKLTQQIKADIACEFEQAAVDVLIAKTISAAKKYNTKTLILGGGVAANKKLRGELKKASTKEIPNSKLLIPDMKFTTDNAAMIAVAGYFNYLKKGPTKSVVRIKANGNLSL